MIEQIKELLAGRPVDISTYDYAARLVRKPIVKNLKMSLSWGGI